MQHVVSPPADPGASPAARLITISLAIENRYEDGCMIPTRVTGVVIPAPPLDTDDEAMQEWERSTSSRSPAPAVPTATPGTT